MRLRVGDLIRCKECIHTMMWCPDMMGQLAVVSRIDYGPTHSGENDLLWIYMPEKSTVQDTWINQAWTSKLWEKVEV